MLQSMGSQRVRYNLATEQQQKEWNRIKIQEIGGTTDIQDITSNEKKHDTYYDLSGRPVENPTRGIYILNNRKVFIK